MACRRLAHLRSGRLSRSLGAGGGVDPGIRHAASGRRAAAGRGGLRLLVGVASRKQAGVIVVWSDYVSPYAFVAKAGAYALEADYEVELQWRPYTLDGFTGESALGRLMMPARRAAPSPPSDRACRTLR